VVGLIAIGASKAQWTAKCLSGGLPDHESQYRLYVEEVLSFAVCLISFKPPYIDRFPVMKTWPEM